MFVKLMSSALFGDSKFIINYLPDDSSFEKFLKEINKLVDKSKFISDEKLSNKIDTMVNLLKTNDMSIDSLNRYVDTIYDVTMYLVFNAHSIKNQTFDLNNIELIDIPRKIINNKSTGDKTSIIFLLEKIYSLFKKEWDTAYNKSSKFDSIIDDEEFYKPFTYDKDTDMIRMSESMNESFGSYTQIFQMIKHATTKSNIEDVAKIILTFYLIISTLKQSPSMKNLIDTRTTRVEDYAKRANDRRGSMGSEPYINPKDIPWETMNNIGELGKKYALSVYYSKEEVMRFFDDFDTNLQVHYNDVYNFVTNTLIVALDNKAKLSQENDEFDLPDDKYEDTDVVISTLIGDKMDVVVKNTSSPIEVTSDMLAPASDNTIDAMLKTGNTSIINNLPKGSKLLVKLPKVNITQLKSPRSKDKRDELMPYIVKFSKLGIKKDVKKYYIYFFAVSMKPEVTIESKRNFMKYIVSDVKALNTELSLGNTKAVFNMRCALLNNILVIQVTKNESPNVLNAIANYTANTSKSSNIGEFIINTLSGAAKKLGGVVHFHNVLIESTEL